MLPTPFYCRKKQFSPLPIAAGTVHAFVVLCLLIFLFATPLAAFARSNFPSYPIIEKNVHFWELIYGTYSTSQAVVHDPDDLDIIYTVTPIFSYRLPGASKINKPILKGIKNKYAKILKQLANGVKPQGTEEKRVASLFAKASRARLLRAADSVRIQIGQKDRFIEGEIRSGAYIKEIKRIFRQKGLPEELAYLPHVESSFDIRAYSKFGASGIWQFTRSTGKDFLTINYEVDERQDPLLASYAAATFLKRNFNSLQSWPLAITAYNYGPSGMRRAQKAHGSYDKIFKHYKQGYFKFASRNFYSEFLAALKTAKRMEKNPAITLQKPKKTLYYKLPAFIAAQDISTHFNISLRQLRKLNPALRKPVFQGKKYIPKNYILNLPDTQQYAKRLSMLPSSMYHSKQKPTQFYRVKRGDTAGAIAGRFGISLRSLRRANNLNKNAAIFVGQNLRIPGKQQRSPQNAPITIRQGQTKISKTVRAPTKASPVLQTIPVFSASKKERSTWKKIQTAKSVVLGELSVRNIHSKNGLSRGTITIQPEESIEILADWLRVQPETVRRLNSFQNNRILYPDESIHIPLNNISARKFEEKRFDFHLETEEDFFNAFKIVGVQTYTVQEGDTVWEICRKKFDLPFWLLKKYNTKLDFSGLRSSQQLTIPIVKAI